MKFHAIFILLLLTAQVSYAQEDLKTQVVGSIPTDKPNMFYRGNRAPLMASALIKLPVGSVRPEGWLRQQLELMSDGFTGHLTEISKWCRFNGSAWVSPDGKGQNGWEELPYWLKGFIDLGYVLGDKRITDEATKWIEGMLSNRDSTGYFGPRGNRLQHDIWPNMVALYALRTHYDATGDKRVLDLMKGYFHWLTTIPLEQYLPGSWQKIRGGDNLDHIYWLYNQTGDQWLLDLARINHERTADWTGGLPTWHGVNLCQGFREPAEYFQQSGDIRHLNATERNYSQIMTLYGQVPGGMFGADEEARPGYAGPRQAAETCSMVEFMHSDEMLSAITGNTIWADRCEEIAFNSLPASMTPDLKGLHYLTAPNMIQLDKSSKAPMIENDGAMFNYDPSDYRCCQHNVAFGWPYYAEHLWMATPGNGLAAVMYSASTLHAKAGTDGEVQITESTDYPFGEFVEFTITTQKPVAFPLFLRIPGWCSDAHVVVNGKSVSLSKNPVGWIVLEKSWKSGDMVRLELPMAISVKIWEMNNYTLSVYRGPLIYSLKIGERWEKTGGTDLWPAYEVYPSTPWNYGLIVDLKNPVASFEVVKDKNKLASQPFTPENAPIVLKAVGKRIPAWKQEENGLIGEIKTSPVRSSERREEITLIPMGCARLRVSVFPRISESADVNEWR